MNRDTIIGFVLIAAILVGYSIWMTPSKEEMEARQRKIDSIAKVRQQQQLLDSVRMEAELAKLAEEVKQQSTQTEAEQPGTYYEDSLNQYLGDKEKYGAFAHAARGDDKLYVIENEVMRISITSKGGGIIEADLKNYQTWDSLPLIIFDPDQTNLNLSFFSRNRTINTNELYFKPFLNGRPFTGDEKLIAEHDSLNFSMRLMVDDGFGQPDPDKYIAFEYVLQPDDYMLSYDIQLVGMQDVIASNAGFLTLAWDADLLQHEKSVDRFNGSTIYFKHHNDDVDYLSESKDDEEVIRTRVKWVSYKQRFFSSSLIADNYFDNAELKTFTKTGRTHPRYLKSMSTIVEMPYTASASETLPMSFYFGPNSYYEMRAYKLDLERQIPLGWGFFLLAWINIYIVIPVFTFLGSYGWNYGIVILILTLLLKLVLFPIAYKTYLSSAKMRVLKPEIDEISAKFPKKEDAMKKQQAVMALYKKAGANPMSGCIPMLLQMPILIAMFRFFPSSIELRQQSFLWATDLSSYDSILNLPFEIPFYGDHVSLFTLLMTVSTIIYTHVNNQMMGSQSAQLPGMKTMMYIMPVMFLGIFNGYASGLSYYYFLANMITFAQMYIFRISIDENKLRARIEQNKKKPVKKSAFQRRLEEAAKQRGYKMPK
ncbi:MAG: membrane protein insertase YidC [Bacteroidales bacterium]|jgi:YidC/Oxa1 family membrane protein insertase|nr:membrane protein insertase YidC [Bacteroidales bacterium]MDD4087711.1 membrane protein insertase YidC [Bacteroidales bacterium]MDY0086193.1 membrane protein insertase YidC [Bacteroidales bacterium]